MCVKVKVEIRLNGDPARLDSLIRALEPDNIDLPEGMALKIKMSRKQLVISAEGGAGRVPSILNTLDEIISLAKSSLETVGDKI
ncbi:MAG: KEOPS complex subunit Pcc1 [Nitrososphaeria archaeon]